MKICVDAFDVGYAPVHDFAMQADIPKLLRSMLEHVPCTQPQLAKRLSTPGKNGIKISQSQISRWINGQEPNRVNFDRIVQVARDLGLIGDTRSEDVAAALPDPRPLPKTVKLKGYVGASSEAFYYRLADEELEEVPAPDDATDQTVAVEVRGKSLGPLLESWLVYYDDVRSPITPDLLGKLCVVGLADDRIVVKRIERDGRGRHILVSNNSDEPISDVAIEWAAKVTAMRPR